MAYVNQKHAVRAAAPVTAKRNEASSSVSNMQHVPANKEEIADKVSKYN